MELSNSVYQSKGVASGLAMPSLVENFIPSCMC